jgi:hypothetical protein
MRRESLADLPTFIAVANSRNFPVAASQVGVTTSALSHFSAGQADGKHSYQDRSGRRQGPWRGTGWP